MSNEVYNKLIHQKKLLEEEHKRHQLELNKILSEMTDIRSRCEHSWFEKHTNEEYIKMKKEQIPIKCYQCGCLVFMYELNAGRGIDLTQTK
jgi:hypothetical protein